MQPSPPAFGAFVGGPASRAVARAGYALVLRLTIPPFEPW